MGRTHTDPAYERMSVSERILYLQDLWDRLTVEPGEIELTEAQREELDRRLAAHRADPAAGSDWDDVQKRIRSGR